jgi:hypothetical protein
MTEQNPTWKQHFVPQFYLKNFADDKGFIQVLDVKNQRIGQHRPYPGVGYEPFFYAVNTGVQDDISQKIEDWLKSVEDWIALQLPRIIASIKGLKHVTENDRYILSVFMSLLWLRAPAMREEINKMQEELQKQIMKRHAPWLVDKFLADTGTTWSEKERTQVVDMLRKGSYGLKYNNVAHMELMVSSLGLGGPGFANVLYAMNWQILLACGKERFITADSPVVEWWDPPKIFYGMPCHMRNKYFALTPEIMLVLTPPRSLVSEGKAKRRTLFEDRDDEVRMLNMLLLDRAARFAYGPERRIFEELLQGRKQPGELERNYVERYVKPWKEYREWSKGG